MLVVSVGWVRSEIDSGFGTVMVWFCEEKSRVDSVDCVAFSAEFNTGSPLTLFIHNIM